MKRRIDILGISVDALTMDQTIGLIKDAILQRNFVQHVVVNAAKMVNAQKDQELRKSIQESDIINADGQAVVWASKFIGDPLPERVAGIDLMERLVEMADKEGFSIYLLGAQKEVLERVVLKYKKSYSEKIIAGFHDGYFKEKEEISVAQAIADSKADILFVAMSSPKKEIFINKYKNVLNTPFVMGVGGSFDVISGMVKRAPLWMQKSGLEWLFRVIQEPRRMWKRYLVTNTLFVWYVIKAKFSLRQ